MEYKIRVKPGKEKAFLQLIQALQSLGIVERVKAASGPGRNSEERHTGSSEEMASQYRDLVD